MKKLFLFVVTMVGMVLTSTVLTTSPAVALTSKPAVENPYTPAEACHEDFGGTWTSVTDGHRAVTISSGAKWGDVYLLWNDVTKYNCSVTIKRVYIGTESRTVAGLRVEGKDWVQDANNYKYYAAVQAPACNKRVMYDGFVWNPAGTVLADGGRYTWGNGGC